MALSALRTVLLDLDGTLIDHFQTIYRCYAESLHQLGLEPVSYEKVKATVGGGIRVTFSRLVPEEHVEPGVKLWMECFERHWAEGIELLPGVEDFLDQLHGAGLQTAIYTNKEGPAARRIVGLLGWEDRLAGVFGRLDTPWAKPDARFTGHVLEQLGARPETTLMIGDSPFDAETARNAGLGAYVVATGSHSLAQLEAEADADGRFPDLPALARELWNWQLKVVDEQAG